MTAEPNSNNDLGGFSVNNWSLLREKLKDNLDYSDDWQTAMNWFQNRLNERYFNPMAEITPRITGVGFTIMSILCIIIEHMASMTKGKIHDQEVNGDNPTPSYKYKFCARHFKEFLIESPIFSEYFGLGENPEFIAADFYKNVRCALLHEACTKNNWRINTKSCGYVNPDDKIFITEENGIKRIYRDILEIKIREFVDSYLIELKTNYTMRLYFARKMDSLCEIDPEPEIYEWWKDE